MGTHLQVLALFDCLAISRFFLVRLGLCYYCRCWLVPDSTSGKTIVRKHTDARCALLITYTPTHTKGCFASVRVNYWSNLAKGTVLRVSARRSGGRWPQRPLGEALHVWRYIIGSWTPFLSQQAYPPWVLVLSVSTFSSLVHYQRAWKVLMLLVVMFVYFQDSLNIIGCRSIIPFAAGTVKRWLE